MRGVFGFVEKSSQTITARVVRVQRFEKVDTLSQQPFGQFGQPFASFKTHILGFVVQLHRNTSRKSRLPVDRQPHNVGQSLQKFATSPFQMGLTLLGHESYSNDTQGTKSHKTLISFGKNQNGPSVQLRLGSINQNKELITK